MSYICPIIKFKTGSPGHSDKDNMANLIQKSKAGKTTGSLFNYLMGNNATLPEVGKGATILHWTDRSAYEVIEVSENKMECTIQRYDPERVDGLGMSDSQSYKYEKLTEQKMHLVWRQGAWRAKGSEIVFTKEFIAARLEHERSLAKALTEEQRSEIYQGEVYPQKVVAGITREKKVFHKVNIIFGVKREYYDYSF